MRNVSECVYSLYAWFHSEPDLGVFTHFGQTGPHKFMGLHIPKNVFSGSSGYFSCIIAHYYPVDRPNEAGWGSAMNPLLKVDLSIGSTTKAPQHGSACRRCKVRNVGLATFYECMAFVNVEQMRPAQNSGYTSTNVGYTNKPTNGHSGRRQNGQ